jgi:hypothetical protein
MAFVRGVGIGSVAAAIVDTVVHIVRPMSGK